MYQVAIVIPNWNYGRWLRQSIVSALAQTEPCEVVVADGGSTDESLAICHELGVRVVYEPRRSVGLARNTGIEATAAPWIVSLDADDWLEPNCVERCLSGIWPSVGIIAPGLRWEDRSSIPCGSTIPETQMPDVPIHLRSLLDHNQMFVSSMFRRQAWMEAGKYWAPINEDWELWVSILAHGWEAAVIQEPLLHHRAQPLAISTRTPSDEMVRVRAAIRAKHADLLELYP